MTEDETAGWHRRLRELVMDREAWRAAARGVAKSRTRLSDWAGLSVCEASGVVLGTYCVCSVMSDSATPQTVVCPAPLSLGFSGKNTGVGCHFPLQGIFLTRGLNPRLLLLLHKQRDSLPLAPPGNP